MEENDIQKEMEDILRKKQYFNDPRYQKAAKEYLEAVKLKKWKEAHDMLVLCNLLQHQIQDKGL